MRVWVCFDDTDTIDAPRGTGKLARWFESELPQGCGVWGVVRQQLLVDPRIPYTSHNSSACVVVDGAETDDVPLIIERAIEHLERHALEGSDPGLCVVAEDDPALGRLIDFGRRAAVEVVSQSDAFAAARGVHLSGHGGTNDGVIGAAAGVGLTVWGWAGRFVEFGDLRAFAARARVADIEAAGMLVLPVDRNVVSPRPDDLVETADWLRPRLWGGVPAVPVTCDGSGVWLAIGKQPGDPLPPPAVPPVPPSE
jgi:hypothetical protein